MKAGTTLPRIGGISNQNDDFYAGLGKRIRQARERRGITQAALASLVQLTRSSIANIERGRQKLLIHTLVQIADAVGIGAGELLPVGGARGKGALDGLLLGRPKNERDWIASALERKA